MDKCRSAFSLWVFSRVVHFVLFFFFLMWCFLLRDDVVTALPGPLPATHGEANTLSRQGDKPRKGLISLAPCEEIGGGSQIRLPKTWGERIFEDTNSLSGKGLGIGSADWLGMDSRGREAEIICSC